ncbi:hypothetical protein MYX76_18490, partial [Desulfobacterota bacterium AH_259_B03_O07]|nr:hypothetical protein [Desulfobacterota bacterium AH_259_B03_O07]
INEEIGKRNLEIIDYEISKYFRMKRSREKKRKELEKIDSEIATNVQTGKPVRTIGDLIEDGVFVLDELLNRKTSKGYDKRIRGLIEVMRSIPRHDYSILKKRFQDGKVLVQIPDERLAGSLVRVAGYKHCILYLAPILETKSYEYVKKIAGHEVAHLFLHSDFSMKKKESVCEAESDLKVIEWGF